MPQELRGLHNQKASVSVGARRRLPVFVRLFSSERKFAATTTSQLGACRRPITVVSIESSFRDCAANARSHADFSQLRSDPTSRRSIQIRCASARMDTNAPGGTRTLASFRVKFTPRTSYAPTRLIVFNRRRFVPKQASFQYLYN